MPLREESGELVGVIQYARSLEEVRSTVNGLILVLLPLGLGGLVLATVGGLYMSGRAVRPIGEAFERQRSFVANASHELKTPLTAIRGYSETMLDPELAPDLVRRFAEVVKTNADRLQRIVDDLLDLSRVESGGWVVQPRLLSVAEIAADAWSAELAAASKAVDFSLDIDPAAARVFADPAALRQVFANLFSNAIRYTGAGGTVRVRSTVLPPPGRGEGRKWASIEVEDSGTGIPAVHLPRVFERFYRVDPARSRTQGGTGLGLAIVKHLVEAHGGQIQARSQLGRGTTIRFTLPLSAG